MSAKPPQSVLLSRFRLNWDALRDRNLLVLDFPWRRVIDQFLDQVRSGLGRALKRTEFPPYWTLNTALTALAPTLVHSFRLWKGQPQAMLALGTMPCPNVSQIRSVVEPWATSWAQSQFQSYILSAGRQTYREFQRDVGECHLDWDTQTVEDVLRNKDSGIFYTAIPSLLASLLNGQPCEIGDDSITWHLAQERDSAFALVSDLQLHSSARKGDGAFAYLLRFSIHQLAGSNTPWIHLSVHCRRYAFEIKKFNYGRGVTVMIGIAEPRLAGWPVASTLVPIKIKGYPPNHLRWDNRAGSHDLVQLLEMVNARPLATPGEIIANPEAHLDANGDRYYVVYSEGLKPDHPLESGFSIGERTRIIRSIIELINRDRAILEPDTPIAGDTTLRHRRRPAALRDTGDVQANIKLDALIRACGRPTQVLICWESEFTRDATLTMLRQRLGLDSATPFPEWLSIDPFRIPGGLLEPLDHGGSTDRTGRAQRLKKARQKRTSEWYQWLKGQVSGKFHHYLALIEIRDPIEGEQADQSIHGAVREAGDRLRIGTQMLRPIYSSADAILTRSKTESRQVKEDRGRVRNAVQDLLLRQTGVLFGEPSDLYQWVGLPKEVSNRLTVIGLHRVRWNDPMRTNFALAVRIMPKGQIEMRLPVEGWQPYLIASLALGSGLLQPAVESHSNHSNRRLYQSDSELASFIHDTIVEATREQSPVLVIAVADDWRTRVWPQLANGRLTSGVLDFRRHDESARQMPQYTPAQLPGLRVARLRHSGNLIETPQYIATRHGETWENVDDAEYVGSGLFFRDNPTASSLPHYGSIAELPETAYRQTFPGRISASKRGPGANIAFRQQTIVEIVPFFLQSGDNPDAWARLIHALRISTAWDGGNTVNPFPIHLALTAANDRRCLLELRGNSEEWIGDEETNDETNGID